MKKHCTTLATAKAHLKTRRFSKHMRAALCRLAADPQASYRAVAKRHSVDLADLYRNAKTVPGLVAIREGRRRGSTKSAA